MKLNQSFLPLALGTAAVSLLAGGVTAQAPLVPQSVPRPLHRHRLAAPPARAQEPPVLSGASAVSAPVFGSAVTDGPLVPRTRPNAAGAPPGSTPAWTFIGPAGILNAGGAIDAAAQTVSGRVAGIAADPTDVNTFYVAAAGGGVWKTTDGGASYVPLTDYLGDTAMGSIAVAPSDRNTVYAGTGEANFSADSKYGIGLLKSTDGGATWSVIPGPSNVFYHRSISKIVVDPTSAATVYLTITYGVNGAYGNSGVWKSTDGGVNWTNTTALARLDQNSPYTDLVIDPVSPQTLYTAIGDVSGAAANGVYKTTDGGATWAKLTTGLPTSGQGRISLALAPSAPQTLYASVAQTIANGAGLLGLYQTADGGATWAQKTAAPNYLGGQGWYDNAVVVSPVDPSTVFVGGVVNYNGTYGTLFALAGSRDGGSTFQDFSIGQGYTGPHTDLHALTFTADGTRLLDGNDGGVWRLENPYSNPGNGRSVNLAALAWTDLNDGLATTQFTGIALHPTDPKTAYGGSQDNGTEKTTGDLPWTQVREGDGGFVRLDQSNPQTVYHEYYGISLERSDDGGQTWNGKATGINRSDAEPPDGEDPAAFYVPYKLDPANQSRVIYATNHVYESLNRADTFTAIGSPGTNGYNPSNNVVSTLGVYGSTIYALAGGFLYATFNDGALWADRSLPGHPGLGDIYVDPSNPQDVFAVKNSFGGGKVFRSTNGGQNWNDITGSLPDEPFNAIQMDTVTDILYVGGDDGVFSSANYGGSWTRLNTGTTGLPAVQVVDLALVNATGLLGVGTHGRGMWTLPLLAASTPSLTFPTPVAGGTVVTGTVTLNGPAPSDLVIGLSSSDSSAVRVHRAVVIPAGSSSATFTINTYHSQTTKTVTIRATVGTVTLTKDLTITGG